MTCIALFVAAKYRRRLLSFRLADDTLVQQQDWSATGTPSTGTVSIELSETDDVSIALSEADVAIPTVQPGTVSIILSEAEVITPTVCVSLATLADQIALENVNNETSEYDTRINDPWNLI